MALTGQLFRLGRHLDQGIAGAYVLLNASGVLLGTGLGLFFSLHALANGHSETPDLAVTAGALASGIVAFGVQALFGAPGMRDGSPKGPRPRRAGLTRPRHPRLLKGAGLVDDRSEGTRRIYQLRDDGVEAVRRYFADVWDEAITRFHRGREHSRRRAMTVEPLVVEFEVGVPPDQAFDAWTRRCGTWWPDSHTVSRGPVAITPLMFASVHATLDDPPAGAGLEGTVLDWKPPGRLRHLCHLCFDPSEATEVEGIFAARANGTAVRPERRGWERLGEAGPGVTVRARRGARSPPASWPRFDATAAACAEP
jgi:DNA-binding transcriptional ArsR family regulator